MIFNSFSYQRLQIASQSLHSHPVHEFFNIIILFFFLQYFLLSLIIHIMYTHFSLPTYVIRVYSSCPSTPRTMSLWLPEWQIAYHFSVLQDIPVSCHFLLSQDNWPNGQAIRAVGYERNRVTITLPGAQRGKVSCLCWVLSCHSTEPPGGVLMGVAKRTERGEGVLALLQGTSNVNLTCMLPSGEVR